MKQLQDFLLPDVPITWKNPTWVERFTPRVNVTLAQEALSELPVVVAARVGEGLVIFLAADFDPNTGLGYTRVSVPHSALAPTIRHRTARGRRWCGILLRSGFREKVVLEKLVASWRTQGVRAIYAAAWHFYPQWHYDYDRLIRVCHEQASPCMPGWNSRKYPRNSGMSIPNGAKKPFRPRWRGGLAQVHELRQQRLPRRRAGVCR